MQSGETRFASIARRRAGEREGGAAAVEFGLVVPFLLIVLFGILQYGFFFNDSMATRNGLREGVRQGVVRNFTPATGCSGTDMQILKCNTKASISAISSDKYVKVVPPSPWAKNSTLQVCAVVKSAGAVGLLPMPNSGWVISTQQMSIEQDTAPLPTGSTSSDALPAGAPAYPC